MVPAVIDPPLYRALLGELCRELGAGPALLPPAPRLRGAAAWLETQLAQLQDADFGVRFARACPVPGMAAADYQARLLQAPGAPALLAGIRFKGGDLAWPFVDLLAWDRPLYNAAAWDRVLVRVEEAFGGFRPRAVRVRLAGEVPPPVPAGRRAIDQWLVAGRLRVLKGQATPPSGVGAALPPALRLGGVEDLAFVEELHAAFVTWRAQVGPRGAEVHVAQEDELVRCLETGAVVCAWWGGTWAGVAAAARARERAVQGYEVVELFLDAPLRGRGLAARLQGALVAALSDRGRDALFGTIHASNTPSLRTALRCGRQVAETWWFLSRPTRR